MGFITFIGTPSKQNMLSLLNEGGLLKNAGIFQCLQFILTKFLISVFLFQEIDSFRELLFNSVYFLRPINKCLAMNLVGPYLEARHSHCSNIIFILCFENLDNVGWQSYITPALDMDASLGKSQIIDDCFRRKFEDKYTCFFFGHCKIEFILISLSSLLLEPSETILL